MSATVLLMATLLFGAGGSTDVPGIPHETVRNPAQQTLHFTVADAIVRGLMMNPGLRSIRHQAGIFAGEVVNASLLANPEIKAAYSSARSKTREAGVSSIERPDGYGASAEQAFDLIGRRPIRVLSARAALDAVRAEIAEAEIDVVRRIKREIAEYDELTRGIAWLHNFIHSLKPTMWEMTKDNPGDHLRAEMGFLNFQEGSRIDRRELLDTETELNELMGNPPDTRFTIDDTLEPQPIPVSYEQLRSVIFSRNISLKRVLAELRAAQYGLKTAMLERADVEGSVAGSASKEQVGAASTHSRAFELGAAFPLRIFDQNQGEIQSARAEKNAAAFEVRDVRWEVENDLYKLYQDLNLLRVQIRQFEFGYLGSLAKLLLEDDPVAYSEKRIDMGTWEMDFQRFHKDGDKMIEVKSAYKKAMADLEFLAGGSFTSPPNLTQEAPDPEAPPTSYMAGLGRKAGRGLSNILLSPVEIPASIYGNIRDRGPIGLLVGPLDGIFTTAERIGVGVLDLVTSPVPWPIDAMEPASLPVWDADPWTGSWSLRYFHPGYHPELDEQGPANQQSLAAK